MHPEKVSETGTNREPVSRQAVALSFHGKKTPFSLHAMGGVMPAAAEGVGGVPAPVNRKVPDGKNCYPKPSESMSREGYQGMSRGERWQCWGVCDGAGGFAVVSQSLRKRETNAKPGDDPRA